MKTPRACVLLAALELPLGAALGQGTADIQREADYILACQFLGTGHAADGAINNVTGLPTWVSPRENGLAILALLRAAAHVPSRANLYRKRAELAADHLVRRQEPDGSWSNAYDAYNGVTTEKEKSPTHAAEVTLALHALGSTPQRYTAVKAAARYLLACRDPANKAGPWRNDGLLNGGKDAAGSFTFQWRWASDNAWAFHALRCAGAWADEQRDLAFAKTCFDAAEGILAGIDLYLRDPAPGIWHRAIDQNHAPQNPVRDWINYAPQMIDVPAKGTRAPAVGVWIHGTLQLASGAVRTDTAGFQNRLSPGYGFQASLVWLDLAQTSYSNAAWSWIASPQAALWQTTPDSNGVAGGFIDWWETGGTAPFWQRFIDTSFYAIAVWTGGYDFRVGAMPFLRGDANGDQSIDVADAVRILAYLYGGATVDCLESADADDNGAVGLADAIFVLQGAFKGGPAPPHPFPGPGIDWTPDTLGCVQYPLRP